MQFEEVFEVVEKKKDVFGLWRFIVLKKVQNINMNE